MQQDSSKALEELIQDCGRSNWDGYGAQAISFDTYERARRFAQALPFGIPVPEVSAEPDGEITFEWFATPARVFSVSVGPNNELNYVGLFGASRTYGTEVFPDEIPEVVLSSIEGSISKRGSALDARIIWTPVPRLAIRFSCSNPQTTRRTSARRSRDTSRRSRRLSLVVRCGSS